MIVSGPKANLETFLSACELKTEGKIAAIQFGFTVKGWLSTLFRSLTEPSLIFSLDSAAFLKAPEKDAIAAIDNVFLDYGTDASRDFSLLLMTPTEGSKRLVGLLKRTQLARSLRPLTPTAFKRASSSGRPVTSFRREILKITPLDLLNPFQSHRRTSGRMFFGRTKLLADLCRRADGAWIFGPRRIGKSSLVLKVKEELGIIELHKGKSINRASYVDVSALPDPERNLFVEILKGFDLGAGDLRTHAKVRRLVGKTEELLELEEGAILGALIERCAGQLVIILDEVDGWIYEAHRNKKQMRSLDRLRAYCDNQRARVILVGYEHLVAFRKKENFPFVGRGRDVFLGPTDRANIEKLVKEPLEELGVGLDPTNTILQSIWLASSGRLNIVQDICSGCLTQVGKHPLKQRIIKPNVLSHVVDKNDACIRMKNTVRSLVFPLAQMLAILALGFVDFNRRRLLDALPLGFDPAMEDIDMAFEILLLRFVFSEDPNTGKMAWANDNVRSGAKEFAGQLGKERIIRTCVNDHAIDTWRPLLWQNTFQKE